jgi:hypothetical protein
MSDLLGPYLRRSKGAPYCILSILTRYGCDSTLTNPKQYPHHDELQRECGCKENGQSGYPSRVTSARANTPNTLHQLHANSGGECCGPGILVLLW